MLRHLRADISTCTFLVLICTCITILFFPTPCSSVHINHLRAYAHAHDQLDAHVDHDSRSRSASQVGARASVVTAPMVDAAVARTEIRGTGLTDTGIGAPIMNYFRTNRALGAGLGLGRVEEVSFGVNDVVAWPSVAKSGEYMCDALFNPRGYPNMDLSENHRFEMTGEARSRDGLTYQKGHIIARALTFGGHDFTDPINFFPQHYHSNNGESKWGRMEAIAAHVKGAFGVIPVFPGGPATGGPGCPVNVHINFLYADPNLGHYVPSGGFYEIRTTPACFHELQTRVNNALSSAIIRNDYTKAFVTTTVLDHNWRVGGVATGALLPRIDPRTEAVVAVAGGVGAFARIAGYALRVNWLNRRDVCIKQNLPRIGATGGGGLITWPVGALDPNPFIVQLDGAICCPALFPPTP